MNGPHIARNYLATEVHTAPPQKLQLMLIEGAIRFGQQARGHLQAQDREAAGEAIIRCQQIVAQLLAGFEREGQPELTRQMAGVYVFILHSLVAAHLNHDEQKLAEALDVLAEEQITWRAVCQKLASQESSTDQRQRFTSQA